MDYNKGEQRFSLTVNEITIVQKALNAAVTEQTTKEEIQLICQAHRIILDAKFCDSYSLTREPAPELDNEKLIKETKFRIRQLFLDDSKCELCEKVFWDDGYDGNSEGCEKGLCIECAIHKALVEFANAIARTATLAALDEIERIIRRQDWDAPQNNIVNVLGKIKSLRSTAGEQEDK
jgi:hypothetical protein